MVMVFDGLPIGCIYITILKMNQARGEAWLRRGILAAAAITPFLTLYISKNLFFPYITGKAFLFRILVELMLVVWAGLLVLNWKKYRPQFSAMMAAMIAILVVVGLADLLGVNPFLSFWSRMERMDGYINLLHLAAYFFVLANVLRARWEWNTLFAAFTVTAMGQVIYALMQKAGKIPSIIGGFRVEGTFGNPTYLAAFLLLAFGFSLILMIRARRGWQRWTLAGGMALILITIYLTATRGVMVGLAVAAVLFALVFLWMSRRERGEGIRRGKKIAAMLLILAVGLPALLYLGRGTAIIQQNETLNRLASISLADRTTQARFLVWQLAWRGVEERPILGWGQENFVDVFSKYYDPALYNQEQWFDRAHNFIFDWLTAAGFLGLAAYMFLVGAMAMAFYRYGKRAEDWRGKTEGLVLLSLLAAYLIQNLFVFDNYGTYVGFYALAAYAVWLGRGGEEKDENEFNFQEGQVRRAAGVAGTLAVILIVAGWWSIYQPYRQAATMIEATKLLYSTGSVGSEVRNKFLKAVEINPIGRAEVREQMGKIVNDILNTTMGRQLPKENREAFVKAMLAEMEKELENKPDNLRNRLFLGTIYTRFAEIDKSFLDKGTEHLEEAIRISPRKQQIYFALAENYMKRNEGEKAFQLLGKAVELAPEYHTARANYAFIAAMLGRRDVVEEMTSENFRGEDYAKVGSAYITRQEFTRALVYYEKAVELASNDAGYRANLAGLYLNQGRRKEAIEQALKAREIDPNNYMESVNEFLKNVGE